MNDTRLAAAVRSGLTEVCDSLSTVHMAVPVNEIMARADRTRRHRRQGALAGAGGLAAAALAVSVSVALPASTVPTPGRQHASHNTKGPAAQLAAWTVTRQADGSIRVTFFGQLRDPARLQRALRADGVPASVTFIGQQNPACRGIPVAPGGVVKGSGFGMDPQNAYDQAQAAPSRQMQASGVPNSENPYDQHALVINPSTLPTGAGLQIAVMRGIPLGPSGAWPYPKGSGQPVVEVFLVKASPQCTGS
jgi:hypothetical protein